MLDEWIKAKNCNNSDVANLCVCVITQHQAIVLFFCLIPHHLLSTPSSSLWWNINSFIYKRFLFCVFSKHTHTREILFSELEPFEEIGKSERAREEKVKWLLCIIERNFFFFFFAQKSLIDGGVRCCRRKMIYMITKNSVAYVNV